MKNDTDICIGIIFMYVCYAPVQFHIQHEVFKTFTSMSIGSMALYTTTTTAFTASFIFVLKYPRLQTVASRNVANLICSSNLNLSRHKYAHTQCNKKYENILSKNYYECFYSTQEAL